MDNKEHNQYAGAIEYSNMLRDDLLKDSKKAELGFKVSLLHLGIYLLTFASAYIYPDALRFFFNIIFMFPIVAWIIGGFKRLWKGLFNIAKIARGIIPIFPINDFIAFLVFFYTIAFYMMLPIPFFWKMRRNIKRELDEIENHIKSLESPKQEEENEWLIKQEVNQQEENEWLIK